MKVSRLKESRPTRATIEVLGDQIAITYDRALIDGTLFHRANVREKIANMILDWDVTNDDGTPYAPPTDATDRPAAWLMLLEPLPDDVLSLIYRGILEDYYAEKKVVADSSAT